jgi:endoglucanase
MKKNGLLLLGIILIFGLISLSCATGPNIAFGCDCCEDDGSWRNMSTMQIVLDMGLGINLGNTMEAAGPSGCSDPNEPCWICNEHGRTIAAHETAWGSVRITKEVIQGYKNAGFNTLRIPVAWSNLMDLNTYTIHPDLLNRVQQIVDWTLEAGMYAIVNLHWDGGWLKGFPTEFDECMKRYTRIWEQVAERFKDYPDYLLLESQNEELGWNQLWNQWGSMNSANLAGKRREYEMVNIINQKFVDIVRNSGGNNCRRHLVIAGYNTNIDRTIDQLYKMPNDPANSMAVKVHYYDPFGFTHLTQDEPWAQARWTWGTQADHAALNSEFEKMERYFVARGIPVVIGEYGMAKQGVTQAEVTYYTLAVTRAIFLRGMAPMLWCVQLQTDQLNFYYNRRISGLTDPALEAGMREIAALHRR